MSGDPFAGLPLTAATADILELAVERRDHTPLDTFTVLVASIEAAFGHHWETVQLRATFIDAADSRRFADPGGASAAEWRGHALTQGAAAAFAAAADLARRYDLLPLPPGVLALGLAWRPDSGAARALLEESELSHPQLLELLQDEVLGTSLVGLELGPGGGAPPPQSQPQPAEPQRAGAFSDATTGAGAGGPRVPPPGASLRPPDDAVIREVLAGAETLAAPSGQGSPWLFRKGERELTLYDLADLGAVERRRIEAEASVWLSFNEIPGAAAALGVEARGDWLVVETERLGESLAEHLAAVAGGEGSRVPAEQYAAELAGVARTLQELHDHGIVHGDLEASKLRVDLGSGNLAIAGFALGGLRGPTGVDRPRAPEWFAGEIGPSVDQYALGLVAHDVLTGPGAPSLPAPVHKALQRATAQRPADRFPTIGEFGEALQAAVRAEAPRSLSERVAALSPAVRFALTPSAIAALLSLAGATAMAPGSGESPELSLLTSLLLVVLVSGFTFFATWVAAALRGRRTFASLPPARNPLVPFVAFCVLFLSGVGRIDDSNLSEIASRSLIFAYGGCALLAPVRTDSAAWLVRLLRLWNRRFLWSRGRRRAATVAVGLGGLALLAAPTVANLGWSNFEYPTVAARQFDPLLPVWNFRVSLDHGDFDYLCNEVLSPPATDPPARCRGLAKLAAGVQSADPATEPNPESFGMKGTFNSFRVQELPTPEALRAWNLLSTSGRLAGGMYTQGEDGSQLVVMISRDPPQPRSVGYRSMWLYVVAWRKKAWRIIEYRACEVDAPGNGRRAADCVISSKARSDDLKRVLATGEDSRG